MGRAWYRPDAVPPIEDFTPEKATITHPFSGIVYRAYVDEDGTWWQEERVPGTDYVRREKVDYVVGSGNHTRSYITTIEGELRQLPLTWYARRKIWDMSPGYEEPNHRRFDRPISPECMFCHNDLTPWQTHRLSRYEMPLALGITCTRCHGDGTAHVAAREAGTTVPPGQPDPTIVNPAHLPALDQLRICQQCHLQGESRVLQPGQRWDRYDVRTPLAEHESIYVPAQSGGPEFSIASHGHRLSLSACAIKSGPKLRCTTCHDPHKPASTTSHRVACMSCHTQEECGSEHGQKPDASCAECHMRKGGTSDIPHVSFTDHFIRSRPGEEAPSDRNQDSLELVDALAPLGPDGQRVAPKGVDRARLGIAHAIRWRFHGENAHGTPARQHLEAGLAEAPEFAEGWLWLARLRAAAGESTRALTDYERYARRVPENPVFRIEMAQLQENMGRLKDALATLEAAIAIWPEYATAWTNRANVLQKLGRHPEAETAYARATELSPTDPLAATNRAQNYAALGRMSDARRWFVKATELDPMHPIAQYNLAGVLLQENKAEPALAALDRSVKADPKFPLARWLRGQVHIARRNIPAALEDAEAFVVLAPGNPEAHLLKVRALLESRDLPRAAAAVDAGLTAVPNHPELLELKRRLVVRPQ
jgi:tetratricopeptide (TPR) repeat protein